MLEETLRKALRAVMEASVDTGVADDTSLVTRLDDSSKNWPVNAFVNLIVEITGGTGEGQIRKIASNTATSIVPITNFATAPDATSTYRIGFFGKMASEITGQVSALLDSTTTPLGDGLTYTGASKACDKYARIIGSIFTDHASTLYIDQSQDGTNWDYSSNFAVTASTGLAFSVEVVAPYCRLRVVNSAGAAQTVLRAYIRGRVI